MMIAESKQKSIVDGAFQDKVAPWEMSGVVFLVTTWMIKSLPGLMVFVKKYN